MWTLYLAPLDVILPSFVPLERCPLTSPPTSRIEFGESRMSLGGASRSALPKDPAKLKATPMCTRALAHRGASHESHGLSSPQQHSVSATRINPATPLVSGLLSSLAPHSSHRSPQLPNCPFVALPRPTLATMQTIMRKQANAVARRPAAMQARLGARVVRAAAEPESKEATPAPGTIFYGAHTDLASDQGDPSSHSRSMPCVPSQPLIANQLNPAIQKEGKGVLPQPLTLPRIHLLLCIPHTHHSPPTSSPAQVARPTLRLSSRLLASLAPSPRRPPPQSPSPLPPSPLSVTSWPSPAPPPRSSTAAWP
jgi:hypothetical protein